MFIVADNELLVFYLRSFLFGALLSLCYLSLGLFRSAARRVFGRRAAVAAVSAIDLIFCLAASFFNILLVFSANRGQVRLSALALEAAGFRLCFVLLRSPFGRATDACLSFLHRRVTLPFLRTRDSLRRRNALRRDRRRALRYDRRIGRELVCFAGECVDTIVNGIRNESRQSGSKKDVNI